MKDQKTDNSQINTNTHTLNQRSAIPIGDNGQPITHPELVLKLAKAPYKVLKDLTPDSAHMLHMASCIMGEVAELVEALLQPKDDPRINLLEELGDIEFYMQGIRQEVNIPYRMPDDASVHLTHDPLPWTVIYSGHIFDAVKKVAFYVKPLDLEALSNAMFGLDCKLAAIYEINGFTRQDAQEHNIGKLSVRYAKMAFSNEAAQERADKHPR